MEEASAEAEKPRASDRRACLLGLVVVAMAFGGVAFLVQNTGFSAVSDDDFARVWIAERFAHSPRLDPSGSSWLPFPFWVLGSVMTVFGRSLAVAQGCAIAGAALAGALLFASAGVLGASAQERVAAALAVLALPIAPFLAAATVPELFSAAAATFGVSAILAGSPRLACGGGAALLAASLTRYEVWPIALVAALLAARRGRADRLCLVAALLAVLGPAGWMAWNAHAHGDALHFLRRVASFRTHLASSASLAAYPVAFVRDGAALVLAVALGLRSHRRPRTGGDPRAALGVASLAGLCFLLAGDALGGAPTHHPERALLPVWALLAVAFVRGLGRKELVACTAVALAVLTLRGRALPDTFVDRREALAEGRALTTLIPRGERVVVARDSYAAEATRVAFDRPDDLVAVVSSGFDGRSHDDPFSSSEALRAAATSRGAAYVLVDKQHAHLAMAIGDGLPFVSGTLVRLR